MKIGDPIVYVDEHGQDQAALITQVHGCVEDADHGVNLVFVSTAPDRADGYGRQIERRTSVVHASRQIASGSYWRAA